MNKEYIAFIEWTATQELYDYNPDKKLWYGSNSRLTTEQLYEFFKLNYKT